MHPFCSFSKSIITAVCLISSVVLMPVSCQAAAKTRPADEYVLRAIYFVPTNRRPVPEHIQTIKNYIKTVQKYYQMEMARNGFYKPGTTEGKTFDFEADENGEPVVHIFKAQYDDAHYKDGPAQYGMVYDEISKVFSLKKATYIVWTECCRILEDSTIAGPSCLGGAGDSPGGAGGVAIMGSDGFMFLKTELIGDPRPVDGLIDPEMGPYPIKHGISYGGFAGKTVGDYASTCLGATAHELGHAFNLPHVFINDFAPCGIGGDLMGRGNQGFRGNFGKFRGEYAHLLKANCEMLNVFRVFNPGEPLTDENPPKQTAEVVLENPTQEMQKAIHVKVKASDPESGLYKSFPIVIPPWGTIKSAPFDANGIADYRIQAYDLPYEHFSPQNYNLELLAFDNQGNRSLISCWVPVPKSLVQEYYEDGEWYEVQHGCETSSNRLRLAISMTGPEENTKVYPEIEVRPAGVPFSGKPNFKGEAVEYKKEPVMGYVEFTLPAGAYHWRCRFATANNKHSGWIVLRNHEPNGTDFRIVSPK